jgi:hypothetical protein
LPRITLRSAFSSFVARWEAAMAVSGDIKEILHARAGIEARVERYERHMKAVSHQLSAVSKTSVLADS